MVEGMLGVVTELVWMFNGNISRPRFCCFPAYRRNNKNQPASDSQASMSPPQCSTASRVSIHCGVTASKASASRLARV